MSAHDAEKPPKRAMVTTSGVEVLVDAPLPMASAAPAAPAARAPGRTSSPASVFIRNLEKKWGKFIRMKLRRPNIAPASAEEMHQEVLLTLFQEHEKQNGPPEYEQAYLDQVILNEIRKHARRRRLAIAEGADAEGVAASAPDPQGAVERVQLWRRLEQHLDELSPEERQVLKAREMHEMTFEVIAVMVGRPYGTVVDQHARAMRKLKDITRDSERAAARGARRRRRAPGK